MFLSESDIPFPDKDAGKRMTSQRDERNLAAYVFVRNVYIHAYRIKTRSP